MRMTKDQPWFWYVAATLAGVLLVSALSARNEFVAYKNRQAAQLEQTAVSQNIAAFDKAELSCAAVPPAQKARCFDEIRETRIAGIRAQADLVAQQDMAVWSYGVFLVSLFGLLFSAGGFAALVWTFRETRKMTQAQDRAYVTIGDGVVHLDGTYGLTYRLEVHNSGNTPATFVQAQLSLTIESPDKNDNTVGVSQTFKFVDDLNEVPAKAGGTLMSGNIENVLSLPDGLKVSHGSHYRKTGTIVQEDGDDTFLARIEVSGVVVYYDVFGGQHTLQVRQHSMSLDDDEWRLRDQNVFTGFGV